MDDFNLSTLYESRNEYCSLLLSKLSPLIIQGVRSIFDEAVRLCRDNEEDEKYLMTFQNFLARIPKWNPDIVVTESDRIKRVSGCAYLEELITCVHITQLKVLTSIRVGREQKKIDISIPKLPEFIHRVYIESARRIYKNVYLFDTHVPPLTRQKNARECELIVNECIMSVIRESMPIETILRSYMDPTTEEEVFEEREEVVEHQPIPVGGTSSTTNDESLGGSDGGGASGASDETGGSNEGSSISKLTSDGGGFTVAKRGDNDNDDDADNSEKKDSREEDEDGDGGADTKKITDAPTFRIETNPETGVREMVRKLDSHEDSDEREKPAEKQILAPSSFEGEMRSGGGSGSGGGGGGITPAPSFIGLEELDKLDVDGDEKVRVEGSIGGSDSIQLDFDTL